MTNIPSRLHKILKDWIDKNFIIGISEMIGGFLFFYGMTILTHNMLVGLGTGIMFMILGPLGLLTMLGEFSK